MEQSFASGLQFARYISRIPLCVWMTICSNLGLWPCPGRVPSGIVVALVGEIALGSSLPTKSAFGKTDEISRR